MSESATPSERRRRRTLCAITAHARELTREHGLDGFTMDGLAERVGVSRRTLFNYVPSKIDAVLGPEEHPQPAELQTFLAGGPAGRLLEDLKHLCVAVLSAEQASPEEIALVRTLLVSDPRLVAALHHRFEQSGRDFMALVEKREGARFDRRRTRLLQFLVVGMFDLALDAALADPGTTMAEQFALAFDTAAALFAD